MNIYNELERLRRSHTICDDSYYSCPKAEGGCANEMEGDECNCGADKHNERLDRIIGYLRGKETWRESSQGVGL